MSFKSIVLATAVVLAIVYSFLGFAALSHIKPENKPLLSRRWPVYLYWWPFYDDLYEKSAGRLRLYGWILFPVTVVAYVVWFRAG